MSYPEGQTAGAVNPVDLSSRRLLTGLIALGTSVAFIVMFAGVLCYPFTGPFEGGIVSPILAVELARNKSDLCTVLGTNHPAGQGQITSQEACDLPKAKAYDPFKSGAAVALVRGNTLEDLVFIPFYTLFLYCFAWLMTAPTDRVGKVLVRVVGLLACITAALDYVEDCGIFFIVNAEHLTDELARHTRFPSLGKWSLIGICLALLAAILFRSTISVYSRRSRVVLACLCLASGLAIVAGLLDPRIMIAGNISFGLLILANAVGLLAGYRRRALP